MLDLVRSVGVAALYGAPTHGLRKFGVPLGGAFDRESQILANTLLGNAPEGPVWEIVGSAEFHMRNSAFGPNGDQTRPNHIGREISVAAVGAGYRWSGATLHVEVRPPFHRGYLAFCSGRKREPRLADLPESISVDPIRVLPGPQAGLLDLEGFCASEYRVSIQSDRVGIRLEGPTHVHAIELTSEPACVGAVQMTNSGTPIILGPDGPTLGGYPKVAVVVRSDLDRLAQLAPGIPVRFATVTFDEAEELWRDHEGRLRARLAQLCLAVQ